MRWWRATGSVSGRAGWLCPKNERLSGLLAGVAFVLGSSRLRAVFFRLFGSLCRCPTFGLRVTMLAGRGLVLSLPCDWRFLPKLGPRPSGAALFLSIASALRR